MGDAEEDSKYPPNYSMNQGYGSSRNPKVTVRNVPYSQSQPIADRYAEEDDEDEAEEDEVQEQEQEEIDEETNDGHNEMNGSMHDDHEDDDIDLDDEDDMDACSQKSENVNLHRHPKKRKLKSLLSSYEFAPRVPAPAAPAPAALAPKPSFGGRNTLTDWSEHETFVLLDAWGERFLQCGRKSLRSDEWQEVADKVSQESKIERTDSQCRNRLDTLKKKYKKEKANLEGNKGLNTTWVYFKKMDMLMSASPQQPGVDSAGYGSVNPSANLICANRLDEMGDSLGNSDSREGDDDSDLLPPKRVKSKGDKTGGGSLRLLADSVNKFSDVYEKIECNKMHQMVELENMRMDFLRDLELQKRQILDRAREEIAKIWQGDYEENDVSGDNLSG